MVGRITSLSSSPKEKESREPSERTRFNLMFRDDFEDSTPKPIGVSAATGEVTTVTGTQGTVMPYEGARMLKVQDADSTDGRIYYQFGQNKLDTLTVDLWFQKNSDLSQYHIILESYDKITKETYKLRFLESGMKLQYWNSAGSLADVSNGSLNLHDDTWNHLKMCVDLENKKYVYFQLNGLKLDLSTISCQSSADTSTEGMIKIMFGATTGANNKASYSDDFRIYLNEV